MEELEHCQKMSEAYDQAIGNVTMQLMGKRKELEGCKRKEKSLKDQLSLCKTRTQSATAKAAAAWKKWVESFCFDLYVEESWKSLGLDIRFCFSTYPFYWLPVSKGIQPH